MTATKLPEKLNGNWIWLNETNILEETHIFFRRDFTLDELPLSADLWVTARSSFQIFINGRHCTAGPLPHPQNDSVYVCHINADYLLRIGVNQIAVQTFNPNAPQTNSHAVPGGMWLQLDIGGEPFLWSDENWRCIHAPGYFHPGIHQCLGGPNVEMVDFRKHPADWIREPFTPFRPGLQKQLAPKPVNATANAFRWQAPSVLIPVESAKVKLVPEPNPRDRIDQLEYKAVVGNGTFAPSKQMLWVDFRRLTSRRGSGIYIAETYIHSKLEVAYDVGCYCNRPYRLFLNSELQLEQAAPPPPVHSALTSRGDQPLAPSEFATPQTTLHLEVGWNRLFLVIDSASCGNGLTILFDDAPQGTITTHLRPDLEAEEGWAIAGPLRTPFALVTPQLPASALHYVDYTFRDNFAWDMSLLQQSYQFTPGETPIAPIADTASAAPENSAPGAKQVSPKYQLKKGEYIIFDFGQTVFGYPIIRLKGYEDDVALVVCGEHLVNNRVLAFTGNRRNLTTLTLDGRNNRWIATSPSGFRYVMIQCQSSMKGVIIDSIHARVCAYRPNTPGAFTSSDEVLNNIWATGAKTLQSTIYGRYLDSPTGDQTQYIADAMIQSWAAFHLFGEFDLSKHTLAAFASTQLETGEINSACPSGLFQVLPDYSFLWIIWLHRHYLYTGDLKLLDEVFPNLERLLRYYNSLAVAPDGPIGDLQSYLGMYPFLDHDNDIDRTGISTGLNGIYARALLCAAQLAEAIGNNTLAGIWQKRSSNVVSQMHSLTWDAEKKQFADSSDGTTKSHRSSWQSNILALFGGFVPESDLEPFWNQLAQDEAPFLKHATIGCENPYFLYFVLDVAFAIGKAEWAYNLMRHYWGKMLEAGAVTWWEMFTPKFPKDSRLFSRCHGYGTSPNCFLISDIAGIRPAVPGMEKIYFAPTALEFLPSCKVVVPTIHGKIEVEWQTKGTELEISLNATYPLEVIPEMDEVLAAQSTITLGDNITLAD